MNKMATRAKSRKTLKPLLLVNQWTDFKIITYEYFLGNPLPQLLKPFRLDEQDGRQSYTEIETKTFKRLLLLNQWMDFEIISHECSLGNPLPKLLKPFCSSEWNDLSNFGRESPKEYSYEIILKLGQWPWRRCRFKGFLFLARMNKMAARAKIRNNKKKL